MMRALVIGNGQPLAATLRCIPEENLIALLTSDEAASARTSKPVYPEDTISDLAALNRIGLLDIDLLLIANSTKIIPPAVLEALSCVAVNFHPGLLPNYAGLHTHQWAIRNGENSFAVTLHHIEKEIDTGQIVAERHFPVTDEDTGLSLFRKCLREGSQLLSEIVPRLMAGEDIKGKVQDISQRRLYRHAEALDDRIDWQLNAEAIRNFVRAGNYTPLRSPTYTARLQGVGMPPVEVLRVEQGEAHKHPPCTLIGIDQTGPCISCGDGESIVLTQAICNHETLHLNAW